MEPLHPAPAHHHTQTSIPVPGVPVYGPLVAGPHHQLLAGRPAGDLLQSLPFPFRGPMAPFATGGGAGEPFRVPFYPALVTKPAAFPALMPLAGGLPAFTADSRRLPPPPPMPFPPFMFSQADVDMVLYGYARPKPGERLAGHALSGLRIAELSYGIDRILGCNALGLHPALKSPSSAATVDPSTLDLPEGLDLMQTTFAGAVHYGVFCRKLTIPKGARFGPFRGKQVNTSEIKNHDDNSFMWEIFQEGRLSHFIDGRGNSGNWMAYVNCARYAQEQNMIAVQVENEIWYESCKEISQGTELLVWYGESYLQFMGIPVALKDMVGTTATQELENSEGYQCTRCGKVFAYRYYRDKHLKYTRCVDQGDRKFPCHLCTRSFEKRDRLRIHILHVHEKHRPHKCTVCAKSFSQSSSLNKHMRVHSGERPYKCVYCNKAFTASSILRTHIRQHSGEKPFKCKHCGKAFASHAAHDSHVRRTHSKDRPCVCQVCGKTFIQAYELKFHMNVHAGQKLSCSSCGRYFVNISALEIHKNRECRHGPSHAGSSVQLPMGIPATANHVLPPASMPGNLHDINMNTKSNEPPIDVVHFGSTTRSVT